MTPRWVSLVAWLAVGSACSTNPFRGGYPRPDTHVEGVKVLASYVTGHCEDATHGERTSHVALVELAQTQNGRLLLLEHREGYDLLVAENFNDDGAFWVFQVVLRADGLVREWRLPRSSVGTGSLLVGRELRETSHADRFRAALASPRLSCTLVPKASALPLDVNSP